MSCIFTFFCFIFVCLFVVKSGPPTVFYFPRKDWALLCLACVNDASSVNNKYSSRRIERARFLQLTYN